MLNMSKMLYNKRFSQPFTICRKIGDWDHGEFIETCLIPAINTIGTILPASRKEIMQFPEGDRSTSMMSFHSPVEIMTTHVDDGNGYEGTSDEIYWKGNNYKILGVDPYGDFGFYKAYGVLMEGE